MVKLNNEVTLDIKLNTEDLIKDLKKIQKEAKKATQAVKEYEATYLKGDKSYYVQWNQDNNYQVSDIETVCLSDIPTEFIQKELFNREDVNELNLLLNLAGKYGFLLTATDSTSRGIGKTPALVQKAIDENLAILVGSSQMARHIHETYGFKNTESCHALDFSQGRTKIHECNGFLVDDLVPSEKIVEFANMYNFSFKGGFSQDIVNINSNITKEY